jgi:nucleoside-diphosphate-sugar epimerase
MSTQGTHVVTGAFGYSGKWIARRLLDHGCTVRTLTNSRPRQDPFGGAVAAEPFHFDEPEKLVDSLRGVAVLHNTYWVRFNHRTFTFADAIRNLRVLFDAARRAGVERIVHVSITNPSLESPLEYFRGKAEVEEALRSTGVSYAILRPAVLFGELPEESILINNIAWMLRRLPAIGVFGRGEYRLQPIHVADLARLAVEAGARRENETINAIGPETFTYRELVKTLGRIIGHWRPMVAVPPAMGYLASCVLGKILGDVIVTRDEITGLMGDMLYVDAPPTGTIELSVWAKQHANELGRRYANELARRR